MKLTAIIEREGDGYVSLCPDLDIASQGNNVEKARNILQEALELFFETASAEELAQRLHVEVFVTQLEVAVGETARSSGQQICDILSRKGFIEIRRRGSHIVMQKRLPQCTITIPVPDHHDVRIGTPQSIIRHSNHSHPCEINHKKQYQRNPYPGMVYSWEQVYGKYPTSE